MADPERSHDTHEDVDEDKARHDEGQSSTRRYVTTADGRTVPAESKPVPEHGESATAGGGPGADDQQQGNPPEAITEGDAPQRP